MAEGYDKKSKLATKHGYVPMELTVITPNDKKSNDRRQIMSKNVRVQTELTAITLNHKKSNDRRQVVVKNVRVQTDQTEIALDAQQKNDRRQVKNKDVGIQTELTATTFDDGETNFRGRVMSEDVEIKNDSSHQFGRPHLNINGEEIHDQRQVAVVMKVSGNGRNASLTNNHRIVEAITKAANLKTTNIINDIRADLGPIVGYAEEPLLPLLKACAPLTDIIHNLSLYVQMALNETPEVPPDGLTIDESAAIRLYTIEWDGSHRSLYSMLNRTLKKDDREHLRPYFKYLKLLLTALVKLPCVPPLTIWRGVTKNMSAEFPPGTPVTWWAFSSCTTELTVLESNIYLGNAGDRTLFSVEAINGRTIRAHSHFVTEDEILLLPGTHMIVQSQFSPAPDLHIIHLKQVIPEEVLLEPPFEGSLNIFKHLFSIAVYLYIGARLYPKVK
jgi:hypothetical protein